jgi:hypothetical protein
MTDESHDPLQHTQQMRQTLSADKLSVGFFLGAGCPCAVRTSADAPLIPDIKGLTAQVLAKLAEGKHSPALLQLQAIFAEDGDGSATVETMLNRIRSLREVAGKATVRGLSFEDLDELDRGICNLIRALVTCNLPGTSTPYHELARFIGQHRSPFTEIFTTNYDVLMEQALEASRVPYFDGFVGSSQPFFDQQAIEDDQIQEGGPAFGSCTALSTGASTPSPSGYSAAKTVGTGKSCLSTPRIGSMMRVDECRTTS